MSTGLGGPKQAGIRLAVVNSLGVVMPKGTTVAFSAAAGGAGGVPTALYQEIFINRDFGSGTTPPIDIPLIAVTTAPADTTVSGQATVLGVTAADIPAGKIGEIVCFGVAYVKAGGTITVGSVISADGSGRAVVTSPNTLRNPFGLALTAALVNELFLAFVNGFHTGNSTANFMGKGY